MDIRRDPNHMVHYAAMLVGTSKTESYNLYLTSDNGGLSLVGTQCGTCAVPKKYDHSSGSGTLVTNVTPNTFTELVAISLGNDHKTCSISSYLVNDEVNMQLY